MCATGSVGMKPGIDRRWRTDCCDCESCLGQVVTVVNRLCLAGAANLRTDGVEIPILYGKGSRHEFSGACGQA